MPDPKVFSGPNPFLDSSTPFVLETGFREFSFSIPTDGNYTIGFGAINNGLFAASTNSGLLVEQVTQQPIPEPSTMLMFCSGLLGLAAWKWKKNKNKID